MNDLISPKYQMQLVNQVYEKIWETYKSYKDVLFYIKKWHNEDDSWNNHWENFTLCFNDDKFDLRSTLHNMQSNDLLRIAIDLNVDTPDFIPSVPTFKNKIKEEYESVYDTFVKSIRNIEEEPDLALGLANSTFESLIKEIIKDERISANLKGGETLYRLTQVILKEFSISDSSFPTEVKTISTSLLAISQSIEKLRSEKTQFHGKTSDDLIINDSIYVYLTVNSISTIGLFLNSYYKKKYPKPIIPPLDEDELPF